MDGAAREGRGCLRPWCPAPCKLSKQRRLYKGEKGVNGDARKKKGTDLEGNQLQQHQKPPSKAPASRKPSTCRAPHCAARSLHLPAGLSISTTSPSILPTPHRNIHLSGDGGTTVVHPQPRGHTDGRGRVREDRVGLFPPQTQLQQLMQSTSRGAKRSRSRVFYSRNDPVLTEWGRVFTAQVFIIIPPGSRWGSLAQI